MGARAARTLDLATLRGRYPSVPFTLFGVVRSDDAELLLAWQRLEIAVVAEFRRTSS
ncbi:MAG: hypothetical protein HOP28_06050, partial [Gemmatimonadales bacterium]|nr:hypothetical protein [Gemmatimonadales bacterium]